MLRHRDLPSTRHAGTYWRRALVALLAVAVAIALGCRQSDDGLDDSEPLPPTAEEVVEPEPSPKEQPEPAAAPPPPPPPSIIFVVDASGSMRGRIEGVPKMDIAKSALTAWIDEFSDPHARGGLIAYGHRQQGDCGDIEELVPPQLFDGARLKAEIQALTPRGETPIAAAIEVAVFRLSSLEGPGSIVLVSDGEERCHDDPCGHIERLQQLHDFKLHVVGFDIEKQEHARQLRCLAGKGNGIYTTAATVDGLDDALRGALEGRPPSPKIQENIQIILDSSAAMDLTLRDRPRLAKAVDALLATLNHQVADRDNLAFRDFGGSCEGDNTRLLVKFNQNNAWEIEAALQNVTPAGESTLVDAITSAAEDFDDAVRFEGVSKRVIVIAGSTDSCYRRDSEKTIRERLAVRGIQPDFTFIGIDMPIEEANEFERIAAATGGEVLFPARTEDLHQVLKVLFEDLPVIRAAEAVVSAVDPVTLHLNSALKLVESGDYSRAAEEILTAREFFESGDASRPFRDLARRRHRPAYRDLFDAGSRIRTKQKTLYATVERLRSAAEKGDPAGIDEAADLYDQERISINQAIDELNGILKTLTVEIGGSA